MGRRFSCGAIELFLGKRIAAGYVARTFFKGQLLTRIFSDRRQTAD